jgi:hypothetical protein
MRGIPTFSGDGAVVERDRALLKYQDEEFGGRFFIPWVRFNHPDLGEGEIGGWIPRYRGGNAFPGETLVEVADKHYRFEIFRAGLLPDIQILDATAEVLSSSGGTRIVEVSATVENQGVLATHTAEGAELAGNREDVVWLIGDRDKVRFLQGSPFQKIGVLAGAEPIPGYEREAQSADSPGNRREVKWLISVEGDSPLKVVVSSQKGGTKVRELRIGR